MKCALEHGYSIIRISQEDIYNNTINWKELLEKAINNKEKVQYISKDENLYDKYKKMINI
jgi:very-short-patch-repair endonuclease